MKFYGHLAHSVGTDFPPINRQHPEFLRTALSACLSPEDDTQWGVAVDTLGLLGSTPSGREALETCGELCREAVKSLGTIVSQGRSDLRVRVLQSLSLFFSCSEESCRGSCWSSEQYFDHVHPNLVSQVMSVLKQPFEDLCAAALGLLRVVASREWGQKRLSGHPGLLEYLLDRRVALGKAGKEVKFEVVETLVGSSTAEKCFGSPNFLKLRKYYREGPFFVAGEQALAMEESTN